MSVVARPATEHRAPAGPPRTPPGPWHALRALVRRGLRDGRRAPLTWGVSLGLLSALVAAMYPSIEEGLDDAMEGYPQGLKDALGITDLGTVEAYLDIEVFNLVIPLAVAFFAIRTCARAIAGREERGELDTLLAAPVSRRVLVAGAFAVTGLLSAAVLAVTGLITWLGALAAGAGLGIGPLVAASANVWPLAMVFGGLATLAAGALRRSAVVSGVAAAVLVAMYVFDAVGKATDSLEPLRWASVFRFYGSAIKDGIDPLAFAGLTAGALVLTALGALLFERRDVRT